VASRIALTGLARLNLRVLLDNLLADSLGTDLLLHRHLLVVVGSLVWAHNLFGGVR